MDSYTGHADIDFESEVTMICYCTKSLFYEEDKNYVPQSGNFEDLDFDNERVATGSETARYHAGCSTWVLPCRPDAPDSESESTLRRKRGNNCKIALITVGPLPKTPSVNRSILTMQDCFSKYCLAVPMQRKSSHHVADAYARHLIAQFETLKAIMSDKGGKYYNQIFHHLSDIYKMKLDMTSAYHPQKNG